MRYSEVNNFNLVSPTEARSVIVAYDELNNGGMKTLANTGTFSTSFGNEYTSNNPLEKIKLTQFTFNGEYVLLIEYTVKFGSKEQMNPTSNSSYVLINTKGQIIARYFVQDELSQRKYGITPLSNITKVPESRFKPQFVLTELANKPVPYYNNWLVILKSAYGITKNKTTKSPSLKLQHLLKEMLEETINLINYQAILEDSKKAQ